MFSKNHKKFYRSAKILSLYAMGVMLLAFIAYRTVRQPPVQAARTTFNKEIPQTETPAQQLLPGPPVRLVIPAIKVDAKIRAMGLTKNGSMEAPPNVADTGWYKYGPHPGNSGSAVLDGHVTGLKGEPGAFSNLGKLKKGDGVTVIDEKGQSMAFIVQETRTYSQNEQAPEVFSGSQGARLNLITCTGSWDKTKHLFSKRLVVFTQRAS
jgi:LPXTG-site transpeptidase (sortase) family protein